MNAATKNRKGKSATTETAGRIPCILTAAKGGSYKITGIPSNAATAVKQTKA
jgi:hypothetical protein